MRNPFRRYTPRRRRGAKLGFWEALLEALAPREDDDTDPNFWKEIKP